MSQIKDKYYISFSAMEFLETDLIKITKAEYMRQYKKLSAIHAEHGETGDEYETYKFDKDLSGEHYTAKRTIFNNGTSDIVLTEMHADDGYYFTK